MRAAASKCKLVKFSDAKCWIYNRAGNICGMDSLVDKLYQLNCEPVSLEHVSVATEQLCAIDLWHQRLGHLGKQHLHTIHQLLVHNLMDVTKTAKLSFCKGCIEGKMHCNPFKLVGEICSTGNVQLIHNDVCGPCPQNCDLH